MKYIFYNLENIIQPLNLKNNFYQPTKYDCLFKFKENDYEQKSLLTGQYANIIKYQNKLSLFYQIHTGKTLKTFDDAGIGYCNFKNNKFNRVVSNKFKYNKKPTNIILMDGVSMHNFHVFIDLNPHCKKDEKWKAIGGYHIGPGYHKNCRCSNNKHKTHEYYQSCWPKKKTLIFDDKFEHKCRGNGLYIYKSNNGIDWNLFHNKPVISMLTECKDLNHGSGPHFDTMPSIFFDENIGKYVLYTRANIKLGCRHCVFSESDDLINWTIPKLIKINPKFDSNHPIYGGDNYYYLNAFQYPGTKKYIAFPSFFKNKILKPDGSKRAYFDECTSILISNDRENWKSVNKIFKYKNNKGHMTGPHILGFISDNKSFYFYVQEKFMTENNTLYMYKTRLDGLFSITNTGNDVGKFSIKTNKKKIFLNYKINKNGFILINNIKLDKGDEISKEITCNSDILNFQILNAEIFSICD